MVVTCDIQFHQNEFGTYFSGQLVDGSVVLKADKPKDVKAVILNISGFAITKWREKRFNKKRTYFGREDYMESKTFLMGSETSQKYTIQSGIHTYNFACKLPENCPTSFEGLHGCIRYIVKVTLVIPWKFNQTYSRGFTVMKMLDLNYESPQLKVPSTSENYRSYCCGPCKTEPLKVQVQLPQTGYVPGQRIPVNALVINNTNIPVAEVHYALVMVVRYSGQAVQQNSCLERITMATAKGGSVLRNCTRSLTQELLVPATPPTCLRSCGIIRITYQVEVEARMKGWYSSQTITIPILIGNVPLWQTPPVIQQQPRSSRMPIVSEEVILEGDENAVDCFKVEEEVGNGVQNEREIAGVDVQSPVDLYPELPPPSYEESSHTLRGDINEDDLHAFGPCEFAPLYPVYTLPLTLAPTAPVTPEPTRDGYINQNFQNDKM
ncbi:arrestin domain-containing protein 17-like [Anastrepha obliqua]|uniref:arrestin domain-containing protein 17-like n=1 Tax=Anastrepha obliqua TaxID=95512 RepID=UPI00240A4DD8|nr:arrestin domain-containing protein 17-like [Anastrepha obliqua]